MADSPTIGVLTALPDLELPAVKYAFGISSETRPAKLDGERYWITELTSSSGQVYRIVVSCIGLSGNTESPIATERMIKQYSPELVIFVGIGCGVRKFRLGDVATSDAIWAYEYVKTQKLRDLDRSRAKITPRHVQDDVIFFDHQADWHAGFARQMERWPEQARSKRPVTAPALHRGTWIASGEKVMGSGEINSINSMLDRVCIGEMEGYGFAHACEKRAVPVPWLVVRGISDFGDESKDGSRGRSALRKDEYHATAAQSAAAFCESFIRKGYTRPEASNEHQVLAAGQHRDGIKAVFSSDHDPQLITAMLSAFRQAKSSIVVAGMGLSFLKGNTELIAALVSAMKSRSELSLEVYYGDATNRGIQNRVREEAQAAQREGRSYNSAWPRQHVQGLQAALVSKLKPAEQQRLHFTMASALPMVTVVRVDGDYFWYPYGTPNVRGKESPWLHLERPAEDSPLRIFLDANIEYYRAGSERQEPAGK